ncbi:uncharacterized protein LOC122997247 isoform X2 [Scomber scombrus]|uniref:Uncharacterized protein LOC122997247 isoform X2 n=1 Tax=Scomber scombrus TaxID=13677 RepID=A0AAV1NU48_SCOSC
MSLSATTPLSIKRRHPQEMCTEDKFQSIKIYVTLGTTFTAEDLLNICLPFGCVVRVQKIVKDGVTSGVVTYSKADEAFGAMVNLSGRTDFFVGRLCKEEARETRESQRPERLSERACPLKDEFRTRRPPIWPLPYSPPDYSQPVYLQINNLPQHINETSYVFSRLPAYAILQKVQMRKALVMLPDTPKALRLMEFLNGLYEGPRHLCVSFLYGSGTWSPDRAAHRIGHHFGLL